MLKGIDNIKGTKIDDRISNAERCICVSFSLSQSYSAPI